MTTRIRSSVNQRFVRTMLLLFVMVVAVTTLAACNGYASVNVGAPLKLGPVYVNPSIGIGGPL